MARQRLTRRQLFGYASGSIAPGVFSTVPGLLLLFYLTDTLGISPGLGGILVLAPKILDVVINPLVGIVSDRADSRWGSRVPFIAAGSLVLPLGLALMFAVPHLSTLGVSVWVVATYALCAIGYSLFEVPYVAVPAEITSDSAERTRINGWRMVVIAIGVLLSGALAPGIVDAGGSGRNGYLLMGFTIGAIVLVAGAFSTREIARIPVVQHRRSSASFSRQWRMARQNRPFMVLMLVYFGQALAIGAQLAAAPYFATYTLNDTSATTEMFVALVGPALLVMPMWTRRSNGAGKSRALVEASLAYVAASLALVAAPDLPRAAVFLLAAVIGVGFAGMQMVPYAMLPDTVDAGVDAGSDGQAGGLSGLWIALETLGFALGPAILAAVLGFGHFHSTIDGHRVPQTSAALDAVRYGFALLPPFLLLLTLPFLRAYRVDQHHAASRPAAPGREAAVDARLA